MTLSTRRLLTGALLVLAAGTGVGLSPAAAYAAGTKATVDVNSTLKVRSAPSLTAKVVGTLRDGQKIAVSCSVNGQSIRGKVRTTVLLGRDAGLIETALAGICHTTRAATMQAAVQAAARFAQPGDTVLLSPACSSLDMFRDYAERGNVFAAAVKELA